MSKNTQNTDTPDMVIPTVSAILETAPKKPGGFGHISEKQNKAAPSKTKSKKAKFTPLVIDHGVSKAEEIKKKEEAKFKPKMEVANDSGKKHVLSYQKLLPRVEENVSTSKYGKGKSQGTNNDYMHDKNNAEYNTYREPKVGKYHGKEDYGKYRDKDYTYHKNNDYTYHKNNDYTYYKDTDYTYYKDTDYTHRGKDYTHKGKDYTDRGKDYTYYQDKEHAKTGRKGKGGKHKNYNISESPTGSTQYSGQYYSDHNKQYQHKQYQDKQNHNKQYQDKQNHSKQYSEFQRQGEMTYHISPNTESFYEPQTTLLLDNPFQPFYSAQMINRIESIEPPPWLSHFKEYLNKYCLILLRDGRKIRGKLSSFDGFSNMIITESAECHYTYTKYASIPLGTMLVRGDGISVIFEDNNDCDKTPDIVMNILSDGISRGDLNEVLLEEEDLFLNNLGFKNAMNFEMPEDIIFE